MFERRLRDTNEAAAYLGVSSSYVRGLVAQGILAPVRVPSTRCAGAPSRRLLFDTRDLDALVDKWKNASSPEPNEQLSQASLKGWTNRRRGAA